MCWDVRGLKLEGDIWLLPIVPVGSEAPLKSRLSDVFDAAHLDLAARCGIAHVNKSDRHNVALFILPWLRLWRLLLTRRPQIVYLVLLQTTAGFIRDGLLIWPVPPEQY